MCRLAVISFSTTLVPSRTDPPMPFGLDMFFSLVASSSRNSSRSPDEATCKFYVLTRGNCRKKKKKKKAKNVEELLKIITCVVYILYRGSLSRPREKVQMKRTLGDFSFPKICISCFFFFFIEGKKKQQHTLTFSFRVDVKLTFQRVARDKLSRQRIRVYRPRGSVARGFRANDEETRIDETLADSVAAGIASSAQLRDK